MPPRATAHPYLKKLGARIRHLREAKGWNQERFAAEAGLDRSYAHGLEQGRRNITVLKLRQIAKALGARVVDFFVTLPMTGGFTNATHGLVESLEAVQVGLRFQEVRMVDRADDADVVLVVRGRGLGAGLSDAMKTINGEVMVPPGSQSVPARSGFKRYSWLARTTATGLSPSVKIPNRRQVRVTGGCSWAWDSTGTSVPTPLRRTYAPG